MHFSNTYFLIFNRKDNHKKYNIIQCELNEFIYKYYAILDSNFYILKVRLMFWIGVSNI